MVWNISVVSLGHLPGCIPSQPTVHPLIYSLGDRVRNREGLVAVKTQFSKS